MYVETRISNEPGLEIGHVVRFIKKVLELLNVVVKTHVFT